MRIARLILSNGRRVWAIEHEKQFLIGRLSWSLKRTCAAWKDEHDGIGLDIAKILSDECQPPYPRMAEDDFRALCIGGVEPAKVDVLPGDRLSVPDGDDVERLPDRPETGPVSDPDPTPEPPRPKPYLSPTQIDMFGRCPEQYRRRYIEKDRIPPGVAAYRGRGVHAGAKLNFRQKLSTHTDLPTADIVDAAVAEYDNDIDKEGVSFDDAEVARGTALVIGEGRDDTARYAEGHAVLQAPAYQPDVIEEAVRIEMPDASHDLFGYVDLIDVEGTLVDIKTSGRKKSASDADTSTQLTVYSAAALVIEKPVKRLRIDVLLGYKRGVDRQILDTERDMADYTALTNRINAMLQAIEAGSFPPSSPGTWWCSPRFCGYWKTCPHVNSDRFSV